VTASQHSIIHRTDGKAQRGLTFLARARMTTIVSGSLARATLGFAERHCVAVAALVQAHGTAPAILCSAPRIAVAWTHAAVFAATGDYVGSFRLDDFGLDGSVARCGSAHGARCQHENSEQKMLDEHCGDDRKGVKGRSRVGWVPRFDIMRQTHRLCTVRATRR
jgi:hypothetical protein